MAIHVLRNHKDRPGVGRFLARSFEAQEVTAGHRPHTRVRPGDWVINYGVSRIPVWHEDGINYINQPSHLHNALDKVETLELLSEHNIPCVRWTTDSAEAVDWLRQGVTDVVYCRRTARGKQGNGIVIAEAPEQVEAGCPLYTAGFQQTSEYRIHVVSGEVIDWVQKRKMGAEKLRQRRIPEVNMRIRNKKRGWVMSHQNRVQPRRFQDMCEAAVQATDVCMLDYAAIDMLYNSHVHEFAVAEVNSAPGMFKNITKDAYVNAFRQFMIED